MCRGLRNDLGNHASAHGATAFADGEAQTFFHGDGVDQLDGNRHVVARHHHFLVGGQLDRAGHVGGAEVELRTVVVEERGDNIQMTVKLIAPIAMEEGLRFAIREGGRTVGAGVVAKIIE